jgi:hypothetical protein
VFPIQIGLILLGAMGSLAAAVRVAERDYPERPARSVAPWVVVLVVLAGAALWIVMQPMEMRGLGFTG